MTEEGANNTDRAEVAEVLERIRRRLQRQQPVPGSTPGAGQAGSFPAEPSEVTVVLRQLLGALQAAHSHVGELNPRPPGPINRLIQVVKKILRRLLSWYTRPLLDYQTVEIQFLSQAIHAIERQQAKLGELEARLAALSGELADARRELEEKRATSLSAEEALKTKK